MKRMTSRLGVTQLVALIARITLELRMTAAAHVMVIRICVRQPAFQQMVSVKTALIFQLTWRSMVLGVWPAISTQVCFRLSFPGLSFQGIAPALRLMKRMTSRLGVTQLVALIARITLELRMVARITLELRMTA